MGRKGDPAARAANKSAFRKSDTRKRKKLAYRSAEERAALLESMGAGSGLLPPDFMADHPEFDGAIAVWRELAGELEKIGAMTRLDRFTFAMYCVHVSDWIDATRDIKANGNYQTVKTVAGGTMDRLRPSVKIREIAERHIVEIGDRFALNPTTRYKMLRDEAIIFGAGQGQLPLKGGLNEPAASDNAVESPTGMMQRRASAPPDQFN